MDRRAFIAASSAAAASLATPALARTRDSTDRLQIGIIGTGLRAQSLMPILLKRNDVDIVAVCDIEPLMIARAKGMIAAAGRSASGRSP